MSASSSTFSSSSSSFSFATAAAAAVASTSTSTSATLLPNPHSPSPSPPRSPSQSASPSSSSLRHHNHDASPDSSSAATSLAPSPNKPSKSILGPGGQYYTPGEAAKLGLTIRTACEACRTRKLKCSGHAPEQGGCQRCKSDTIACIYTARAPIGRPKKRKIQDGDSNGGGKPNTAERPDAPSQVNTTSRQKTQKRQHATEGQQVIKAEVASPSWQHQGAPVAAAPRSDFEQLLSAATAVHDQAPEQEYAIHASRQQHQHHRGSLAFDPRNLSSPSPLFHGAIQMPSSSSPSHTAYSAVMTPNHVDPTFSATPPQPSTSHAYSRQQQQQIYRADHGGASDVPSLDDLSIAAFLQSLDTLEIAPSELMTQQASSSSSRAGVRARSFFPTTGGQGQAWPNGSTNSSGPVTAAASASVTMHQSTSMSSLSRPMDDLQHGHSLGGSAPPASPADIEAQFNEWSSSSAILQDGVSFAVPADFSWWDLGGLGLDPDLSSAEATPATATDTSGTKVEPWAFDAVAASASKSSAAHGTGQGQSYGRGQPSSSRQIAVAAAANLPGLQMSTSWPRGAENGMGQGHILTNDNASATGLSWASLPLSPQTVEAAQQDHRAAPNRASSAVLASSPPTNAAEASSSVVGPRSAPIVGTGEGGAAARSPRDTAREQAGSCCSKEGNTAVTPTPTPAPTSATAQPETADGPSCCAKKKANAVPSEQFTAIVSSSPPDTVLAAAAKPAASNASSSPSSSPPSKVHCVPNPSGKGCTCLCDMSVALLSVKRTLRETSSLHVTSDDTADGRLKPGHPSSPTSADGEGDSSTDSLTRRRRHTRTAARMTNATIQLTLSASQAIAAQCACSADCPTCRSDPSTEISASLLVSTALQIYARAVRTLREGFAAGGAFNVSGTGLDVRIGEYKPAPGNARRIALFAMKLELKDLSAALGKVSKMAGKRRGRPRNDGRAGAVEAETVGQQEERRGAAGWINPIDQLVIFKLHQQLGELLATVENLEAQSSSGSGGGAGAGQGGSGLMRTT